VVVATMACLGTGNGAVFQLVPQRFAATIGIATGLIGAVGGLGGFVLPNLLGSMKQSAGSFGAGFIVLATVAACALVMLRIVAAVRDGWHASWRVPLSAELVAEGTE
jgi:NNP family nitrate/nitrite transporter-like MFS transporter